jgi:suppressor for copper-sensitivity B
MMVLFQSLNNPGNGAGMFRWLVAAAIIGFISNAYDAEAAASKWSRTDHGAVRLIAASGAVGSAESLSLGLHFRMKLGWKIYWRSPGDAGFPPLPDWTGSKNLASAKLSWPAPKRFTVLGLQTLGYTDEVVLPLTVVPLEPGKPVTLHTNLRYLTCKDICVPYEKKLSLNLPAGAEFSSREEAIILRFAARVPHAGPLAGLSIAAVVVDGPPGAQTLRVRAVSDKPFRAPDLYVEDKAGHGFGKPLFSFDDGGRTAVARLAVLPPLAIAPGDAADSATDTTMMPPGLIGRTLTLTVVDGDRAVEQTMSATAGVAAVAAPPVSAAGFAAILAVALLGGLILNLMPCVLPVLSLKLLSVIGHGGAAPARVRNGFLASAAGIVFSFLVLATAAVAMKLTGSAVGWGIQFQNPVFLIAMALVLTMFACNLWGLFEMRLPGTVADAAAAAGGGSGGGSSLGGHFATGVFATLLATPCSAPFLGTAIGFALARGTVEIYAVFTALGIGLALPYLAVAAAPSIATRLPRPGRWMVALRYVLGTALAATVVWLLTVLAVQAGAEAAFAVAALLAVAVAVLSAARALPALRRSVTWSAVAVIALVSMQMPDFLPFDSRAAALPAALPANVPADAAADTVQWRNFDRAEISRLVAAGKVVFVDVTADWCLTCKVNKAVVLDGGEVAKRLKGAGVVAMQADWTRPDAAIFAFLRSFSRYGIPFDVVFGPGTPRGRVLPELLTRGDVIAGLEAAAIPRPTAARPTAARPTAAR